MNRIAKVATNNRVSVVAIVAAVATTTAAALISDVDDVCNKSKKNTNSSALQQIHHTTTLLSTVLCNSKQNQHCKCEASKTTLLDGFNNKYTEDNEDTNHHQNKQRALNIQRSRTLRILTSKAKSNTLSSLYTIDWDAPPMGEGKLVVYFLYMRHMICTLTKYDTYIMCNYKKVHLGMYIWLQIMLLNKRLH